MPLAIDSASIRLVPLGGLGEIGMNCLAVEQEDGILVIDCGSSFPYDDRGIELFHPDFSWLLERADRISGVFLTHGHEDHIGAVPYLLQHVDVPIWGPPHAVGLVERRLAEHEIEDVELNLAHAGSTYSVGPFTVEPVRVAHSIVEASALCIRTRAGVVVHSGDFNFDPDPPDGEPTDSERLRELGDAGVELLLSDSTNVDIAERALSEREVGKALDRLIERAPGRVYVVMFASNVQRLLLIGDIAQKTGRKLCLLGRSLRTHVEVALAIGRLKWPSSLLISPEQVAAEPPSKVLLLAGGTQGEPKSAMRRLANGTHPALELEPSDTVIFSSRIIPGNERPAVQMLNDILRRGVHLHTRITDPGVHTSGHAARTEQKRMIGLLRPRLFIPIHGTLHHMTRHAELAKSLGVEQVLVTENGGAVVADRQRLRFDDVVPHEKQAVSASGEPLTPELLRKRSELGRTGVAFVCLTLDEHHKVFAGPEVTTLGVPGVDADKVALSAVRRELSRLLSQRRRLDTAELAEEVRRTARRALFDISGVRPTVEVQLLKARAT